MPISIRLVSKVVVLGYVLEGCVNNVRVSILNYSNYIGDD